MRWNSNYGKFSKAYFDEEFFGNEILLSNPELWDIEPAFISAMWFYMTPDYPKPSAHDVITGLFQPSIGDTNSFVSNDFGSTIAIMAQDTPNSELTVECLTSN